MKRLETSPISDTSQFPVKKGTLVFLQDAYKEMMDAFCRGVIGTTYDFGKVYVLYGCVNTGTYPIYTISAGAIIYNGEIFFTNAVSFTATGSNVGVWKLVSTYYTVDADPVTLTDASVVNMHRIKKYEVQNGASGSGSQDYSASVFYPFASKKYTDDSVASEAASRSAADGTLQGYINTINEAWVLRSDITDITVTGGSGTAVSASSIKYKVNTIDKTMHLSCLFSVTNTTAPTSFDILIPGGYNSNFGFNVYGTCFVFDGATRTSGDFALSSGTTTKIGVAPPTLTDTQTTQVSLSITFPIA